MWKGHSPTLAFLQRPHPGSLNPTQAPPRRKGQAEEAVPSTVSNPRVSVTACTKVYASSRASTVCLQMWYAFVCASKCLHLGVCVPPYVCTHRAVSHQLKYLSPRKEGLFLLWLILHPPASPVHTYRGRATCPRSHGADSRSFCRMFI